MSTQQTVEGKITGTHGREIRRGKSRNGKPIWELFVRGKSMDWSFRREELLERNGKYFPSESG